MDGSTLFSFRVVTVGLLGVVLSGTGCSRWFGPRSKPDTAAPTSANAPLSADDVSWLFPAPKRAEDFANLIAVRDLTTPDPQDASKRNPVWPDAVFQQFLAIAASPAAQVAGTQTRIGLPIEARSIDAWFVSGVRIDAGAPGLSSDIRGQFGQLPEIRLIIQPVIRKADGSPKVLDIAGHLIFDFTLAKPDDPAQAGCLPRPAPDLAAFNAIVDDLALLRAKLGEGQLGANKVTTFGVPLGVHPGLADATTGAGVSREMKSLLERHISAQRLDSMAIAGLPPGDPAPWIFLSMQKVPGGIVPSLPDGGFIPVHGPTLDGQQFAQMLGAVGSNPRVAPLPHTNNLNPTTCKNAAVPANVPIAERSGVSTTELFAGSPSADQTKQILDTIADPTKSHFFNTDCISCHTETRRAMEMLKVKEIPGIDTAVLPDGAWDVRNFGWSLTLLGSARPTATRRTGAETTAVLAYVNAARQAKTQ